MTVFRPGRAALAVIFAGLFAGLFAAGAAADHAPDPLQPAVRRGGIPVDAMPPVTRAAYLAGIEEELAAHGYDRGPLEAAIRAYQLDAGLPVDGVATKELLDHLKFVLPKVYAARVPAEKPVPSYELSRPDLPLALNPEAEPDLWPDEVTSQPLPDLSPDAPSAPPPPLETEPPRTIGGVVSQVQAALKRRGYYAGPITGRFDPETSAAIRRFQEDRGLPVDGVINATLLNALEAAPSRSEAPTPPTGHGTENGDTGNL